MATGARYPTTPQPPGLTELRLLVELSALRKLAERGLRDEELAVIRKLADATMRSALSGDVAEYLKADTDFHAGLLELTGDPALPEIGRTLLAAGDGQLPWTEEAGHFMRAGASEHGELVTMLARDMGGVADDLLRHHISRLASAPRSSWSDRASSAARANVLAFIRHRADVPTACRAALIDSLSALRRSDDPVVTFASLPAACVPQFADGCQVELSDGTDPLFRARCPDGPDHQSMAGTAGPAAEDRILLTPFQVRSRSGCPPYAGVVTYCWDSRAWRDSDAIIAELIVHHVIALVDHERLMMAVARAEDQAGSLALGAISARTINMATGIVMHQFGLAPDDAEDLLRKSAQSAGSTFAQVVASVVDSGAFVPQAAHDDVIGGSGQMVNLRLRAARSPSSASPVQVTRPASICCCGSIRPAASWMNVTVSVVSSTSGWSTWSTALARPSTRTARSRLTGPVRCSTMLAPSGNPIFLPTM